MELSEPLTAEDTHTQTHALQTGCSRHGINMYQRMRVLSNTITWCSAARGSGGLTSPPLSKNTAATGKQAVHLSPQMDTLVRCTVAPFSGALQALQNDD